MSSQATQATIRSATRAPELATGATSALGRVELLTLSMICAVLAVGAYLSYPLYDDGWLALALRESGPHFLAQHMGDRPIFGFALEHLANFGAGHRIVFVLMNTISWFALAIESGLLFRKLFPEYRDYSPVAACLTLAPIVLQTQLSTAMVTIPDNLPTILGFAAILVLLRLNHAEKSNKLVLLTIASVFAGFAVVLSEYGVATNLVGSAILVGVALTSDETYRAMRRQLMISAAWLFSLTVIAYLVFAKTADFAVRPDVAPAHMVRRGISKWLEIPFDVCAGVWHAVIGAYATALGSVTVAWDSKSTLVAVCFGLLIAALLYFAVNGGTSEETVDEGPQNVFLRIAVLIPSLAIGLLPFSLMGRPTTLLEYGSRFRIPIMPVAAAITVALLLNLVRHQLRWVPVAMLGFVVGYASWTYTYTAIQQSKAIAALQTALKPYVTQSEGYTVAVVPFNRFESELTASIASAWPVDLEKRLWVVGEEPARLGYGSRSNCHPITSLDVQMRGLSRAGKLDNILWVENPPGKPATVEPYCRPTN